MVKSAQTSLEEEIEIAKFHLKDLIEKTGTNHEVLSKITESDLRKSISLRHALKEYKEYYLHIYEDPK